MPTPSLDYDYWEENRSVEARAEIDLSRALSGLIVGAGYVFEEVGRLSRVGEDLDGNAALASLPFTGRQSYAFAMAAFDSTIPHQTFFTLGPQGGRRVEATCKIRGKETGSEREARELILSDREYIGLPFGCALNLTGLAGLGDGEQTLQSLFQIGGVDTLFPLRGYPGLVDGGEKVFAGSGELLFPLYRLYRGRFDLPLYLDRLYGAFFYDAGRVLEGGDGQWRRGVGGEARIETVLGYKLPITFAIGYAGGLDEGGESGAYFRLLAAY